LVYYFTSLAYAVLGCLNRARFQASALVSAALGVGAMRCAAYQSAIAPHLLANLHEKFDLARYAEFDRRWNISSPCFAVRRLFQEIWTSVVH
jgi:hypothetical protein